MRGFTREKILEGRDGILDWMRSNPPDWGYEPLWVSVDAPHGVDRWRHWLPGEREDGSRDAFEGLTEYVYAGGGRFSWAYSTFDTRRSRPSSGNTPRAGPGSRKERRYAP